MSTNQTYNDADNDLYEYDEQSSGAGNILSNATGRVKQFLGSSNEDNRSQSQYRRDFVDSLCSQINQSLIIPKAFYFFFFAAFGSLFPLMGIYFKQMAMSPIQVGILFGLKPFVEFLSAPFWANMGERWRQAKLILLGSLICWIIFTLGIGFIKPPVHSCLMHNETHIFFEKSKTASSNNWNKPSNNIVSGGYHVISKRSVDSDPDPFYEPQDQSSNWNVEIASLLLRKKRQLETQDHEINKHFKVVNVTKLIKVRKTTTTTTTTKPSTLRNRINNKPIKGDSSSKQNLDQATNTQKESAKETQKNNKQPVEEAVQSAVNQVVKNIVTVDSKNGGNNDQEEIEPTTTTKKTKKTSLATTTTTTSTTTEATTLSVYLNTKPIENYFDAAPLDRARSKIVYLNGSMMDLVKPTLETSIVYHKDDVHKIFLVFLLFILAGEFFSAPAITMADSCTLQYLGPTRADLYGRQRMFGSIGWALAMFIVGIILDHSKAFTNHPCGKAGPDERNYSVCFAIYSVLMGCALVVATQFKFNYGDDEQIPLKSMKDQLKTHINKVKKPHYQQYEHQAFENEADEYNQFDEEGDGVYAKSVRNTSANMEQANSNKQSAYKEIDSSETTLQRYMRLFQICKSLKHLSFMLLIWYMGIGVGIVFTFLFWHLQDLGGSPALYGFASVINHLSELAAYFFVHQIVRKYGHLKIFYVGLFGNAIRFIYVSILTEPYWILPFEFIQGITHALVWATATSYFAQSVPEDLRATAQGILQGVHFGLGRGCGAIFGGVLITMFGSKLTFLVYGLLCFAALLAYIGVNNYAKDMITSQNPNFTQNAMVNAEGGDYSYGNTSTHDNNQNDIPEINSAINPMVMDSNYYFQPSDSHQDSNSSFNPTSKSSFPIAPHGAPSTNPNWSKQFTSNRNF